jgi:hypothetical protein
MSDARASVDRFEIEALGGEFTDAVMMRDDDRVACVSRPALMTDIMGVVRR